MPLSAESPFISANDHYRRQARRVRARFAGDPHQMLKELGDLARRRDACTAHDFTANVPDRTTPLPRTAFDLLGQFAAPLTASAVHVAPTVTHLGTGSRFPATPAYVTRVPASHGSVNPSFSNVSDPAWRFAALVESCLEGQLLRYTRRTALLRAADRMGIGRFDANLLIASVQHRCSGKASSQDSHHQNRWWTAAGVFVLIEALCGIGAWWFVNTL